MSSFGQSPGGIQRVDTLSFSHSGVKRQPDSTYGTLSGLNSPARFTGISQTSMMFRDEVEIHPESSRKLEEEFETTRNMLHDSKMKVRDRSREVSDQKMLNSDLKNKMRLRSPAPFRSPVKTAASAEVELENNQLEHRLKVLMEQWKDHQNQDVKNFPYSLHDELALQNKYSEQETANFMLKAQYAEFQYLKKLMIVFQEENLKINNILASGGRPTEDDILFIKTNIAKIREEIEKILAGRSQMSQKFKEMFERIELLTRENEQLRLTKTETSAVPAPTNTKKVKDLMDEISILKRDLQWAQITRPDAGLIYRLEHENSKLKQELENLKEGNIRLRSNMEDSIHASNFKARDTHSTAHTSITINHNTIKKRLGDDDYQRDIYMNGAHSTNPFSDTEKKIIVGSVSNDELGILEKRIEEFGKCNQELEEMIDRLKGKIDNTSDSPRNLEPTVSLFSPGREELYHSKEAQQFGRMIGDLRSQVDKLCTEKNHGDPKAIELLKYLQYILRDSNITQEVDKSQQFIIMNNRQMAADLTEVRLVHQHLEAKYNTLVGVNAQNEVQLDQLQNQNRELHETIKRMIAELENTKVREREVSRYSDELSRRNSQLHELNEDATRKGNRW